MDNTSSSTTSNFTTTNNSEPVHTDFPFKFKLTQPQEIIEEVLRFYTLAPGNWNVNAVDTFSLSSTLSLASNPDDACEAIQRDLMEELAKYFPHGHSVVSSTYVDNGGGNITISILVGVTIQSQTYRVSKSVLSKAGTLVLLNDNVDISQYLTSQGMSL